jgi:nucleotidyltransferase substrate binding protein (TIGR01987 family)
MNRAEQREKDFARALDALTEGAAAAKSALEVDGVIQRFEFTYELFWKLLSDRLREQGLDAKSPKRCFDEGQKLGWIVDEGIAFAMLNDRNETVHRYGKTISRQIFRRIKKQYVPFLRRSFDILSEKE